MSGNPIPILTHAQRVCRLYKKAVRLSNMWHTDCVESRYEAILIRDRFEKTRNEQDMRKLAAMLDEAEEEVFLKSHPQPFIYKNDPGGIMHNRTTEVSDAILDTWHPWEKAQFIDYFNLREQRKKEYIDYFENSILAKGQKDTSKDEYPSKSPLV